MYKYCFLTAMYMLLLMRGGCIDAMKSSTCKQENVGTLLFFSVFSWCTPPNPSIYKKNDRFALVSSFFLFWFWP